MNFTAVVRQFTRIANGALRELRMSQFESLAVVQGEDHKTELARAGCRFMGGNQIIANGIAPVTAIPTTTATLALWNGEEQGSGKSLIIDRLGFWLGSGTPTAGATLMVTVSQAKIASEPTAHATGYGVQSMSGSSAVSRALWTTAVTLPSPTNRAPAWTQVCSTFQLAAANVGQGDAYAEFHGGLIVPPKYALGLAILSGTGTSPLYGISATWSELGLDLE